MDMTPDDFKYLIETSHGKRLLTKKDGVCTEYGEPMYKSLKVETKIGGMRKRTREKMALIAISQALINILVNNDATVRVYGEEIINGKRCEIIYLVGYREGGKVILKSPTCTQAICKVGDISTLELNRKLIPEDYRIKVMEQVEEGLKRIEKMKKQLGEDTNLHKKYMQELKYSNIANKVYELFNHIQVVGYSYEEAFVGLYWMAEATDNIQKILNTKVHNKLDTLVLNKTLDSCGQQLNDKISIKITDEHLTKQTLYHEYGHYLHYFYIRSTSYNKENEQLFNAMARQLRQERTFIKCRRLEGIPDKEWRYYNKTSEIIARAIESYMYFKTEPLKFGYEKSLAYFKYDAEHDIFINYMSKLKI